MQIGLIEYLHSELRSRQKRNAGYSMRSFAKALSLSPGQLSQILSGKRPLTVKAIQHITQKLALSPKEQETHLTQWSLARAKSSIAGVGIGSTGKEMQLRIMRDDEFRLIADWQHFAILSLSNIKGAKADPQWIADRIGISVSTAKDGLARLLRLNIIAKGPHLKQITPPISVVSENASEAIRRYHRQILSIGMDQLELGSVEQRDFAALSLMFSKKNLNRYRQILAQFQDQVLQLSENRDSEEVYVFSTQLFPVKTGPKGNSFK